MRVLLLNHEYPPIGGGGGNAARHLATCLVEQGHAVTVLTSSFRDLPSHEVQSGVEVVRVPALRTRDAESSVSSILAYTISATLAAHRLPRPDIVHAFFGVPGGAIAFALRQTKALPYLVSFRGKDVHGGRSRDLGGITGILKAVSMPVWRAADALVANSEGLREVASLVDSGVEVEVIPNGVDTVRFSPSDTHGEGPVRLLYVGRLEPYKGLNCLLDALIRVRGTEKNFLLKIVGDGSLRSQLTAEAERAGLSDVITFLGWVSPDRIPGIYRDADVFVLPSLVEGMPNGVLESMASGLPAIASSVPGTEELIESGTTGITFPPGDSGRLADALIQLMSKNQTRTKMGSAARKAALTRGWDRVAEQYVTLYERLLSADEASESGN